MKEIQASEFKAKCLSILDHLDQEGLVITKHGKPVAKLIPFERASRELIGSLRGKITINGDILSTGVDWEADAQS
jgi:prevent-host-death family protein